MAGAKPACGAFVLTERLGLIQLPWRDTRITTSLEEHDSKGDIERRQRYRWWNRIKGHGATYLNAKVRIELLFEYPPPVDQEPSAIVMGGIKGDIGACRRCWPEFLSQTWR